MRLRSTIVALMVLALVRPATATEPHVASPNADGTATPSPPAVLAPSRPASPPASNATANEAALAATNDKFNAYIAYMNRTLRVIDSLDRYKSWVNMKTGPTGRERYIMYGLYSVYDVRDERAAAEKEIASEPKLADLDDAMQAYIAANDKLSPILDQAAGYYGREDYKVDHLARGKELHGEIVAAMGPFLAARAHLESVMRIEKHQLDLIRLATIEKTEGRKARWHVGNVMMWAKETLDVLEDGQHKDVDMTAFDAEMKGFGDAVRGMDDYNAEHPGAFAAFDPFPDEMLGGLREVQSRLSRTHGDLRRSGGFELQMILNNYNTMVTTSQTATMFDK